MKNDHRLGWPPALLAMDPDPRIGQRTPPKPPVSAADERARAALDVKLTKQLDAPEPASKPVLASKPDGVDVLIHDVWWHKGGKPPHPGWWNAASENFAQREGENAREVFSRWDGEKWTMPIHRRFWKPDYEPSPRKNQEHVVWREVQPVEESWRANQQ